jgi:hypothetical protein
VLAGAGVAAATAAIALVATSGDVTPSAYAVQTRPGGAVSVSINSLADAAGLQRSLRAAGVPAVVDYVPAGERGCATPDPAVTPPESGSTGGTAPGPSLHTQTGVAGDTGPQLSQSGPRAGRPPAGRERVTMGALVRGGDGGVRFTIDPGTLDPGQHVYITTSTGAVDSIAMAIGRTKPDLACVTNP